MISKYKSAAGGKLILETYDQLIHAWNVPVSEEDTDTAFGRTHLVTAGDLAGPPLLLFHGVGDDSAMMWLFNAQALAARFRIIAVDTLGGPGKSEPNAAYFQHFDQALWIDDILRAKNLDKVYIAGVSNGAYLTQLYTAKRPDRVIKAVCMSGSIAVKGQKSPLFRMMKVFLPEALFPSEKNARKLLNKLCGNPAALSDNPLLMQHWLYLLKYFNTRCMMVHKITGFDDGEIALIRRKTRLLIGACDRLSYGTESLALLDRYQMNYHIVDQAGHALNQEQPALVHQEIFSYMLG